MTPAMASISESLRAAAARLRAAGVDSPDLDARVLLGYAASMSREALLARRDEPLPEGAADIFEAFLERRAAHEPVAYIVGEKEFWSLTFEEMPATLIPRPDSETAVEAALRHLPSGNAAPRVLDLGTGSGCLLLSVLHERPAATGVGVDISADAAMVARRNAGRLGLDARARFLVGDWASAIAGMFDLIIANPPYVRDDERDGLPEDVAAFEPARALFAGPDGLRCYKAIAAQMEPILAPEGCIVTELGRGQGGPVGNVFSGAGFSEIERCRDLSGIERCAVYAR